MKIAIVGTVGVPCRYGGFETLAENLVNIFSDSSFGCELTVWCSGKDNDEHPQRFNQASLRYVNLHANGAQSCLYDAISLWQAVQSGHRQILLLGVSGALALPFMRLISRARLVTNIDGIEWRRAKWGHFARFVLRCSEWAAIKFSDEIIADNEAIADYVQKTYGCECNVIAYGGDHAVSQGADPQRLPACLPNQYALAICRIEPENSVHLILEGWKDLAQVLVFVGNWEKSSYGKDLRKRYAGASNLLLLDPIYDPAALRALRDRATMYVHGHSAGGTNPSLVEMMHFGIPVLAHGCGFNRRTTEDKARYFETSDELAALASSFTSDEAATIGSAMREIAQRRYTWREVGEAYYDLLSRK